MSRSRTTGAVRRRHLRSQRVAKPRPRAALAIVAAPSPCHRCRPTVPLPSRLKRECSRAPGRAGEAAVLHSRHAENPPSPSNVTSHSSNRDTGSTAAHSRGTARQIAEGAGAGREPALARQAARARAGGGARGPGSTFLELGSFAPGLYESGRGAVGRSGGRAREGSGRECVVVANDATVKAGAWFPMTCKKILGRRKSRSRTGCDHLPGRLRGRVPADAGRDLS